MKKPLENLSLETLKSEALNLKESLENNETLHQNLEKFNMVLKKPVKC